MCLACSWPLEKLGDFVILVDKLDVVVKTLLDGNKSVRIHVANRRGMNVIKWWPLIKTKSVILSE